MGWSRFFWLGNIGQQLDLADHDAQLTWLDRKFMLRASADAKLNAKQDARLQSLEAEVLRLGAVVSSLLELLVHKGAATDAEIAATIERGLAAVQKAAADAAASKAAATGAEGKKKVAEVIRRRSGPRRRR
jgi:hypothetical protein